MLIWVVVLLGNRAPLDSEGTQLNLRLSWWLGRPRFDPWVGKIPWRRERQPSPAFLAGESHRQRLPGRLQSMGWKRVRHNWVTFTFNYVSGEQCTSGMGVMLMSTIVLYPRWRSLAFGWRPPLWSSRKDYSVLLESYSESSTSIGLWRENMLLQTQVPP